MNYRIACNKCLILEWTTSLDTSSRTLHPNSMYSLRGNEPSLSIFIFICVSIHVTSNVELRNYVSLLLNVELRNYVISRQIVIERRVT